MYTVSALTTDRCAVPLVYAILEDKSRDTYLEVFGSIRNRLPYWSPSYCMVDFESAAISAIRQTFPQCRVTGCLFHLGKCIWRKIQTLPFIRNLYNTDRTFRRTAKGLQALAFVPEYAIYRFFAILMEELDRLCNHNPEIQGKNDSFKNLFLKKL